MKRLLNTLYVMTQGAYVSREGETVLVRVDNETKLQVPIHTLGSLICFGQVSCSPPLLGLCAERHVSVSFFSMRGRFLARVQGPVSGNVLLRRAQYRAADSIDLAAKVARAVVIAKIANSRTVLLRAARERADDDGAAALKEAAGHLAEHLTGMTDNLPLEEVRGREGDAARTYFSVFNHLISAQEKEFAFTARSRRPPLDNINALLSFLYTVLGHDVASALEGVGLDPAVGYLHRDRPGRSGLALDILEEFRAYIVDRLALTLVNLKQVTSLSLPMRERGRYFISAPDKFSPS